jgi:hypothetical protein
LNDSGRGHRPFHSLRPDRALVALVVAVLLAPGCTRTFRFAPARTALAHVETVISTDYRDGFFLVTGRLNGRGPYRFLLDTGSAFTMVAPHVAAEHEDRVREATGSASDAQGTSVPVDRGLEIDSLELRGVTLHGFDAVVKDLSPIALALETRLDGLLGFPVFAGHLLVLDYPGRQVRVAEGSLPPVDDRRVFPLRVRRHLPFLDLTVGPSAQSCLIDSGYSGWLAMPQQLEHLAVPGGMVRGFRMITLAGRGERERLARLAHDCAIGNLVVKQPIVDVVPHDCFAAGCRVLERFTITCDQNHGRIMLERPGSGPVEAPSLRSTGVLIVRREERWIVTDLMPEGPGARAGLEVGDEILTVDGRPASILAHRAIEDAGNSGDRVTVQVRRGREVFALELPIVELLPLREPRAKPEDGRHTPDE